MKREPIEDRWASIMWENNPELLEYTSFLEQKLKIAEEALKEVHSNSCGYPDDNEAIIEEALSKLK